MNRWLRLVLQTAFGLGLLWLWLRTVSLPEVVANARVHSWWAVSLMIVLFLVTSVSLCSWAIPAIMESLNSIGTPLSSSPPNRRPAFSAELIVRGRSSSLESSLLASLTFSSTILDLEAP